MQDTTEENNNIQDIQKIIEDVLGEKYQVDIVHTMPRKIFETNDLTDGI